MNLAPGDFDQKLRRGAVLRLTLDNSILDDPNISSRAKFVIVLSALLPDDDVWFVMCSSKTAHFDNNPQFDNDHLRWVAGEYGWCVAAVTIVNCTQAHKQPTQRLKALYASGQLAFMGDIRPKHLQEIDAITKASPFLSPEEKRWIVPW
jgi:hypothetical protein